MLSSSVRMFGNLVNTVRLFAPNFAVPSTLSRTFHLLRSSTTNILTIQPKILPSSAAKQFLSPENLLISQVAGFKVRHSLRRRCKDCFFVMRQQRLYVICKTHPRHKQMSMKPKADKTWILTHATQSKVRPY